MDFTELIKKLRTKTSLGIYISDSRISVALVSKENDQIKLLKVADASVPDGAMTDGNIKDPVALAKAIKTLLARNKIKTHHATVSMVAKPVLEQIIDLPEEIPDNLSRFVQSEIKHSPVLSGKEPLYDFYGIAPLGPNQRGRLFVAATDHKKMANLLKTFRLAQVEPVAVELSVVASIRAIFAEKISNKYDANILTAFLHSSVFTVCVFRKEELDFIRSIDFGRDVEDIDKCLVRCEDAISAVIQYYDVEVDDAADNSWELIMLFDNPDVDNRHIEESLSRSFKCDLHVCSDSTVYSDTPLETNDSINNVSVTAVGLAMKSLDVQQPGLNIQLMPSGAEDVRAIKKFLLITANIAAAVIFIIFVAGAFVRIQLGKTQNALAESKLDPTRNIEMLLNKQESINSQIALISEKKAKVDEIFKDQTNVQWDQIMREIQRKIPQAICLNRLVSSDDVNLVLKGSATSFRAIHVFNKLLARSEFFASATVTKTSKDSNEGLINFSILAVLENKRTTQTDVE